MDVSNSDNFAGGLAAELCDEHNISTIQILVDGCTNFRAQASRLYLLWSQTKILMSNLSNSELNDLNKYTNMTMMMQRKQVEKALEKRERKKKKSS